MTTTDNHNNSATTSPPNLPPSTGGIEASRSELSRNTANADRREAHKPGAGTAAAVAAVVAKSAVGGAEATVQATANSNYEAASQGGSAKPMEPMFGGQNKPMALNAQAVGRRQVSDGAAAPVIPDTLNVGIALRIVGIAAVSIVLFVLLTSPASRYLAALAEISFFVAPVLFGSMLAIGLARPFVNGWARNRQWLFSLIVPAVIALVVAVFYRRFVDEESAAGPMWILARVLATVAVTGALVEYLSLRARAFSPSLSEARLQALQARIRPHFLFNSLNTVLGLMRSEPRVAETTLENLSELFRVFMKDTRELIPLQDEMETCRQYLAIEQIRLGGRLEIDWQIEGGPADALVPSLLLQPLVENAVHHGVEPSGEKGVISVFAARTGDKVEIRVINPLLTEMPNRPGNQMALGNVRERLMLLYDMEAELTTEAEKEQFRLTLTFPYRKERRRRDVRSYLNNPDR
jgi:two-component system, LytTR family, sensor histidine kinase AlgZ